MAVAFGSPIGGALFVYELSKPNTFWQFKMIWKVFFSCCICCFTMAIWLGIKNQEFKDWSGALLKFGNLSDTTNVNVFVLIPCAIVIGILGGLMGPLFININTRVNKYRGQLLKTKWIKPIETYFFAFGTATMFFWVAFWTRSCKERDPNVNEEIIKKAWCKEE